VDEISRVPSNRPWDPVGYSRATRVGDTIEVAGTTSMLPDGTVLHPGDMYKQAQECFRIVVEAITQLGGSVESVVRTRMFLTDITRWEEAGKAHREVFSEVLPVSSMLEVSQFLNPEFLVEVEARAIVR